MKLNLKNLSLATVLFTVFLIPFYFFRFSFFGIKTNIFEIFVLVSLWATFVPTFKDKVQIFEKGDKNKFLIPLLLLAITFISIFFSADKAQALGIFKGWFFIPILFAWVISKNFNSKNLKLTSIPIYISLIIVSLWAIFQKLGIVGLTFYQVGDNSFLQYLYGGDRYFGPFESPNFLAMFLVPYTILALSLDQLLTKKLHKNIFFLTLLIPAFALYLTHSRAGFLAAGISALIYLNYRYINKERAKNRRPFFHWFFIGLLVSLNFFYVYSAIKLIKPAAGSDEVRVKIYNYAVNIISDSPIFGAGLGGFYDKVVSLSFNDF